MRRKLVSGVGGSSRHLPLQPLLLPPSPVQLPPPPPPPHCEGGKGEWAKRQQVTWSTTKWSRGDGEQGCVKDEVGEYTGPPSARAVAVGVANCVGPGKRWYKMGLPNEILGIWSQLFTITVPTCMSAQKYTGDQKHTSMDTIGAILQWDCANTGFLFCLSL